METDHRFVWEKNMGRNRHPEQTLLSYLEEGKAIKEIPLFGD